MRSLILFLFLIAGLLRVSAHQVSSVELEFLQVDDKWKLEGLLDIGFMLPGERGDPKAPPRFRKDVMKFTREQLKEIETNAENTMRRILELKFNGEVVPWEIHFPEFEKDPIVLPPEPGGWALMSAVISFEARPGPGKLEAHWHDDQQSELIIAIDEGENPALLSVPSGTSSVLIEVEKGENGQQGKVVMPSRVAQAWSWLVSGYLHVVPFGIDHLLFILGLFLMAPRWKPLLGQSLLFTVAHSITLALTVFGWITLPPDIVGIVIAASIAWIGIENLVVKELKPYRLVLVFAFGLLHGMGFADILMEKIGGLGGQDVVLPLVSFNIGVELAQVSVILAAFLLLMPVRKWTKQIRFWGSLVVALAGLFWLAECLFA